MGGDKLFDKMAQEAESYINKQKFILTSSYSHRKKKYSRVYTTNGVK